MKLKIIAVGRLKGRCERELAENYFRRAERLLPRLGYAALQVRELPESRKETAPLRRREEGAAIARAAGSGRLLLLDERGDELTSHAFAQLLKRLSRQGGEDVAIIIGGPDGVDERLRKAAASVVAFGRLTWPHRLLRIMLAEQIYRAGTIVAGLPYHRA